MRAIELVKVLLAGFINVEQAGLMLMQPIEDATTERMDAYCYGYFGTKDPWYGFRHSNQMYFYLYIPMESEVEAYNIVGELPDAYCYRKDEKDIVALWKMEG